MVTRGKPSKQGEFRGTGTEETVQLHIDKISTFTLSSEKRDTSVTFLIHIIAEADRSSYLIHFLLLREQVQVPSFWR